MTFLRALVVLLRSRPFRRLFVSRVTSQGSDGIFQVALASHVLFNPEEAADARGVALAFAVVLLPYSALGPFVGVLLDRWSRRRVIVVSQVVRAVAMLAVAGLVLTHRTTALFYVAVLLVFSVNRFILAGLAASLPHVVTREQLVAANSVAPTCGSLAYLAGGALGTGLRAVSSDLVVVLVAAVGVTGAAWAATRLPFVGPDDEGPGASVGHLLRDVGGGLAEAVRTLPRRARVLLGLVFLTRLPFGFLLLQTLLLFRGPFDHGSGAMGFAVAAGASALGFASAAFVTPWLAPRLASVPLCVRMLALGGAVCAGLGPFLAPWSVMVIGFAVALTSQVVKITVDSLMQAHVDDHLLGRAFSMYDVVYNAGLVAAGALAAVLLPESGFAWWPLMVLTAVYLAGALVLQPAWDKASRLDHSAPLG